MYCYTVFLSMYSQLQNEDTYVVPSATDDKRKSSAAVKAFEILRADLEKQEEEEEEDAATDRQR